MIILIIFIFYACYFVYLYKWTQFRLGYSSRPLPHLPHPPGLSVLLSIPFGLIIFAGIFWGFTTKPYGDYFSIQSCWLWSLPDMELLFLFPMGIALGFSIVVVYHLGEIKGRTDMKESMEASNRCVSLEDIDKSGGKLL